MTIEFVDSKGKVKFIQRDEDEAPIPTEDLLSVIKDGEDEEEDNKKNPEEEEE